MPLRPHPFAADGKVNRNNIGRIRDVNGRPGIKMTTDVLFASDYQLGVTKDLAKGPNGAEFVRRRLRSAYAQVGLDIESDAEPIDFRQSRAVVPMTITSHRNGTHDQLLELFRKLVLQKIPIEPGGLLVVPPGSEYSKAEVEEELERQKLLLPEESALEEDGTVSMPLSHAYLFAEANFSNDPEAMARVLRDGRHALRSMKERIPLPRMLPAGKFLLAGVKGLSLGRAHGIVQRDTNVQNVSHLPAYDIHPIRTTGVDIERQGEFANKGDEAEPVADIRMRMKLHNAAPDLQEVAARVINPRSLTNGVDLHDLVTSEQLMALAGAVSPVKPVAKTPGEPPEDHRPYGLLIGRKRSAEVPWVETQKFQEGQTELRVKRFVEAAHADRVRWWVDGQGIPEVARPFADQLGYVGHDHHGKMMVTHGFPDPKSMEKLMDEGVGVFVASSLYTEEDAFRGGSLSDLLHVESEEPATTGGQSMKAHALFFDSMRYEGFRGAERKGAKFHMILPDMADEMKKGEVIPAHVREFTQGLWVKPEARERVKKVNTVIAMYGSHVEGMDPILRPQLEKFMQEMKEVFGEALGVTHGKGPGVMEIADDAAAKEGVVRIGVGICIEGQAGNCRPEAMIDFHDTDRLRRQKLMDDLATFKIFNIGGAGTLEEAAITLCSQKLGKKAITPIIFVDPVGAGKNGGHLWDKLREQVEVLSEEKNIVIDKETREQIKVQLLQPESPKYIHCVSSYAEAAEILRTFKADPAAYYHQKSIPQKAVTESLERQKQTLAQTGFASPDFLKGISMQAA